MIIIAKYSLRGVLGFMCLVLLGCFKSSLDEALEQQQLYTVDTRVGYGGSVNPAQIKLEKGAATQITVAVDYGYKIDTISGCGGTLDGAIYTTAPQEANCTVEVTFTSSLPPSYIMSSTAINQYGNIWPQYISVQAGTTGQFILEPFTGYRAEVRGCDGTLTGNIYTTSPATEHCEVEAEFLSDLPNVFVITTSSNEGGQVIPPMLSGQVGTAAQFIIEPSTGFVATANGCNGSLQGDIYVTAPITSACHIDVTFTSILPDNYFIRASAEAGGTIFPTLLSVQDGSSAQLFITPVLGQKVKEVSGCPGTLSENTFTAGPITEDCELLVTFESSLPPNFVVTATAGVGGVIAPAETSVQQGTVAQFLVTPNIGKGIDQIVGCDGVLNGTVYTTAPIVENCEVAVTFRDSLRITTQANYGGTVWPSIIDTAPGERVEISITPFDGYSIDLVAGCSGVLDGTQYVIENVTSPCEVTVMFERRPLHTLTASASAGGTITPATITRETGESASFTLAPNLGNKVATVVGCDGTLSGNIYHVANIDRSCSITATFEPLPPPQNVAVEPNGSGALRVTYQPVPGATSHRIYHSQSINVSPTNYDSVWNYAPMFATITHMEVGTTYFFVVVAVFGTGSGAIVGTPSQTVAGTPIP